MTDTWQRAAAFFVLLLIFIAIPNLNRLVGLPDGE